MLTKTPFIAAALAASVGAVVPTLAETYKLDFEAPRQVGDTFEMRANGSSMQEIFTRVDGDTVEEVATHGEAMVHARGEVLALNELGGVSQVAFELIEYEFETDIDALELDTTKRLIATAVDGEVSYAYEGGGAVGEGYEEVLGLVFELAMDTDSDGPETNTMMNAQEAREVGEDWEMNHAFMAEQLEEDGALTLDAEDINSHVTLVEVAENGAGVAMATVEAELTAENIGMADGQLPPFMKVTDSVMRLRIHGQLALDASSVYGMQDAEMEMAMLAKGKTPEGQLVEIEVEFEREAEVVFTPVAD